LVDRGWISREASRQTLPNIEINNIKEKVFGTLEDPELGFVLSDILVSDGWPKVSQTKSLKIINKEYNDPLASFILVADPILKNSLEYLKIIPTNMMPAKHYGYSAQWFTMFHDASKTLWIFSTMVHNVSCFMFYVYLVGV